MKLNILFYKNWYSLIINETFPISITFGVYLQDLLEGANIKNLVLPIAIFLIWIPSYIIISAIDMYFAAEIEKENNLISTVKKNVYKTVIYKSLESLTVSIIIFCLMCGCLITEVSKDHESNSIGFTYLTMLVIYVFFSIGSIFLKAFKIGNSFEKVEGPKDEFFNLVGGFFAIFKKWFFDKTKNSLNMPEVEKENKKDGDNT